MNKAGTPMQLYNEVDSSDQHNENFPIDRFAEHLKIIFDQRKFIGYATGCTFILSILISLLLPKMFIATARILPPQEDNSKLVSLLSGAGDMINGLAGDLISNKTPAALYVGILKSRSVADALNKRFGLKELYGLKYIEDVYKKLEERSIIEISKKDQIIHVSVMDRDPQRAADMANTFVETLDQINRKLNISTGKRKRLFLEERLKEVRTGLEKAENELESFQEKYHLVSLQDQAKAVIEGAAEIKRELVATRTKLEVFKQFGTEKQIEALMLNAKIEELEKQLRSIEQGEKVKNNDSSASKTANKPNFYIPFSNMPRLGTEFMRLTRQAKLQEKLFEIITAQYEMAQIEEAKDVGTIQILDHAIPPEKKFSPKRSRIVITATLFMFFLASIFIVGREHYIKTKKHDTV